jgi:nucleoside-diphosphate-sugar epimerase
MHHLVHLTHLAQLATLRVLVTGAAGFIGGRLCRALRRYGAEVHGVSRQLMPGGELTWWQADLADPNAVNQIMRATKPDIVYHLASHVSGRRHVDTVLPTLRDNLLTTVNILTAAAENGGPRVLLAGSMEEVGAEDVDQTPGSPYSAAKTASSSYGRMFHELYDLPVLNLRTFMVYGPGQRDELKLIPYVARALQRGEDPQLSSGNRPVDWIYVDDVVDGYLAAAVAPRADGVSVDIGSGQLVTIRSVVEQLVELTGTTAQPRFGALPDRPMEHIRRADLEHTRQAIGWQPAVLLRVGLARTVEWLQLNPVAVPLPS